ncbi:hypothetical protein [Natronomonas sp.]|uniref:hypothetical protein n=1 Tax=Natronomonas sp. TaxID=2184060 RepID=UPI00260ED40E|nr:hypothetical protein [Natronomonas sp.]
MSDDDRSGRTDGNGDGDPDGLSRRRLLLGGGAALSALGAGKAAHNTVLGYGRIGPGTNLRDQELTPLLTERLAPRYAEPIGDTPVRAGASTLVVAPDSGDETRLSFSADDPAAAAEIDRQTGSDGRLTALFSDLSAFHAGEYAFEFHRPTEFFERVEGADARPETAAAIRDARDREVDPAVIERFAGVDPAATRALVGGLLEGFREHTNYDVPRYLAGSVEDNVLLGAHDVRQYFETDVDFASLLEADSSGIFCWELVFRSIEALQAVDPTAQTVPVAACYVSDSRHKHAFTGVLCPIRTEGGELRFPMTFLDYTHSTLYDDLRATAILGDGLDAYGTSHRATDIYW